MADRAPGYEQAAEDLQCYNCGMRGHMFFACPEDTRRVPAGLEASRKRQASASDHHASIKRSKGPVVTHYPPPPPLSVPHIPPPPTTYNPSLGYEGFHAGGPPPGLPPGPPYHQPPHTGQYGHYQPPNPGRSAPRSFSHSNSRDTYEHHFQGAPRVPPPETPYRPPHYDQYDRHRSAPSPSAPYDRPYSVPLDRHDEHPRSLLQGSPYTGTHRAPLQANFEHYPPAPGVDNYYSGPPQPYPPPPSNIHRDSLHSGYGDPSSAQFYAPSHGSPPPGVYPYPAHQYPPSDPPPYHARYDERFADRPSYESQRRDPHPQYAERRSGGNRQYRERHGRRARYSSPKGRSHSERRFLDRPARISSPVNSTPPAKSAGESAAPESRTPQKSPSNATLADNKSTEKYTAEDFSWDEEMIFKELPLKITRDLIREPLPAEWTDDPIMPPKYDKETITSKYINPSNVDDFALSVRETKAWQIMQYHPTFLSPTDVRIERLRDYDRALNPGEVYNKQNHYSVNSAGGRQRGKSWGTRARGGPPKRYSQNYGQDHPSSDDQSNYFRSRPAKRSWERTDYHDTDALERGGEIVVKKPKISSPEPGEVCETDDQPTSASKSPSPSWEQEYHHIPRGYSANTLQDSRVRTPDITSESSARRSSLHAPSTPPRRPRHSSPSPSRPSSIRSSRGGPARPSSRHSSRSNSRPSSRQSSIGSPLTPNERELLGMASSSSGSDSGRDSPTPQTNDASARSRQRPAKLHAAYQRRW